jgi:hypothetical protein
MFVAHSAGAADCIAAARKRSQYATSCDCYLTQPLNFETLAPVDSSGLHLLSELGRGLERSSSDSLSRERQVLFSAPLVNRSTF